MSGGDPLEIRSQSFPRETVPVEMSKISAAIEDVRPIDAVTTRVALAILGGGVHLEGPEGVMTQHLSILPEAFLPIGLSDDVVGAALRATTEKLKISLGGSGLEAVAAQRFLAQTKHLLASAGYALPQEFDPGSIQDVEETMSGEDVSKAIKMADAFFATTFAPSLIDELSRGIEVRSELSPEKVEDKAEDKKAEEEKKATEEEKAEEEKRDEEAAEARRASGTVESSLSGAIPVRSLAAMSVNEVAKNIFSPAELIAMKNLLGTSRQAREEKARERVQDKEEREIELRKENIKKENLAFEEKKEEIKKASRKTERKGAVIGREVGKQEERVAIADAERKRVPGEGPVSPPSFMTKPD